MMAVRKSPRQLATIVNVKSGRHPRRKQNDIRLLATTAVELSAFSAEWIQTMLVNCHLLRYKRSTGLAMAEDSFIWTDMPLPVSTTP